MIRDEDRHEFERLVRLGLEPAEPVSARHLLVARTLMPGAWSTSADEHVAWCARHGLSESRTHIGAQFLVLRRLSIMRADAILRRLDRQAAGRRDLLTFDAVASSSHMEKAITALNRGNPRPIPTKAAKAIFFLKELDGLPSPVITLDHSGSVKLEWHEDGRCATIDISVAGTAVLTSSCVPGKSLPLDLHTWNAEPWRTIARAIYRVHFDGPEFEIPATPATLLATG